MTSRPLKKPSPAAQRTRRDGFFSGSARQTSLGGRRKGPKGLFQRAPRALSGARRRRPAPFVAFLIAVFALAGVVLSRAWVMAVTGGDTVATQVLAYWFFLSLASEAFWIETPTRRGMISMSLAVNLASLLVLPLPVAIWIAASSVLLADLLFHRRTLLRAGFNASQTVISLGTCAWILSWAMPSRGVDALLLHPLPAVLIPLVFAGVNTGLVALVIALEREQSPWAAWRENFGHSYQALSTLGLYLAGLSLVSAYEAIGLTAGLGFLLIFLLVRNGYARYVETHGCRDLTGVRG